MGVQEIGCAIECSPAVLGGVDQEARRALLTGSPPAAGILFGFKSDAVLRIMAHRAVPAPLDEQKLKEAQSDPELKGMIPAGWYVSHPDAGLELTAEEAALHGRVFPEPWQVAMVLQPDAAAPTRGAYLWPGVNAAPEDEFVLIWPDPRRGPRPARVVLYALAVLLPLAALLLSLRNPSPPPARGIALRVSDSGGQLHVEWNRDAPDIARAERGVLEILDGTNPVRVALDHTQLETGSVYYARTSPNARVTMTLQTSGGEPIEESVPFVGEPVSAPPDPGPPLIIADALPPPAAAPPAPAPPKRFTFRPPSEPAPAREKPVDGPQLVVQAQPAAQAPPVPQAPFTLRAPEQAPPKPRPRLPVAGQLIWTGRLERRGVIQIEGRQPSMGHLDGGLPGMPAAIHVLPGELTPEGLRLYTANPRLANRSESAGPQNGWNDTRYVWDPVRANEISVLEAPGTYNGWKHLILRAENRGYSVIVVRWEATP